MLHFADYRQHVDALVQAALVAADPAAAVKRHLKRDGRTLCVGPHAFDLDRGRVWLVGVGKAAVPMSMAAAEIIGADLAQGVVVTKKGMDGTTAVAVPADFPAYVTVLGGSHPVSDADSVRATQAVLEMLAQTTADDLVLCLISGGTSALLTQPRIDLAEWQALTATLLASGCTINELNAVRRRLDRVKGGGLARAAAPARCLSLILSDVVGNPLAAIGSGPTVLTDETPAQALDVLTRYDVASRLDTDAWQRIEKVLQEATAEPETAPLRTEHVIVGDVRAAAMAALSRAVQLGFVTQLLTAQLEGEAREVGRVAAAIAKDAASARCLILGGETTVTLRGDGRGGRNQEVALAAAVALQGWPNVVVASFASDGEDGPTPVAGAVVSGETATAARRYDLDPVAYLDRNDSHTFFARLDDARAEAEEEAAPRCLIAPGPTGTNVNDLLIILTYDGP